MFLSLKIAYKFHRSCRKNVLISLISFISICSITIGIMITIISLSIINGFENELDKRILSIIPHGEIVSTHIPFINWKTIVNKIKNIPNITSINPYINLSGIVEFNNKWHVLHIKSINLTKNFTIYNNHDYKVINFIEKQSWKNFCTYENQIILGYGVSNALNIKTGDWITILFTHDFVSKNKLSSLTKIKVQVAGILNLKSQLDENLALISLNNAQKYCHYSSDIDGIEITARNVFKINAIMHKIKKELNDADIVTSSWIDSYGYIYQDIQIVRLVIYLSIILIIGIACFNVISTLILCIKSKYYDIAILRAIGSSNVFIQHIFLWYGFMIYWISSILGSVLGVFIALNLANIDINGINIFGKRIFPKNMYFIDFIPIYFDKWDTFYILNTVLLLGLLVSWYLSFKIKNIHLSQMLK